MFEHRQDLIAGFTQKYGVHALAYYESTESIEAALYREKQLKKWNRAWKLELIERQNPTGRDLYEDIV